MTVNVKVPAVKFTEENSEKVPALCSPPDCDGIAGKGASKPSAD